MSPYRHVLIFFCALALFSLSQPLAAQPTHEDLTPTQSSSASQSASQALTFFKQGQAAYERRQMQEAIDYWQQALALYDGAEQRAYTLGNLAIAYERTGQYSKALAAHQSVLEIFKALEETAFIGQELRNIGNVYAALGDYEKAIEMYQAGLEIAQEIGDSLGESISFGNLGYIYFLQGKQDEAIAMYGRALAISNDIGDLEGKISRLLNMGLAYHSLEDIHQARALYEQSLALARESSFNDLESLSLMNLGLVTAELKALDNAIEYFEQSLVLTDENNAPVLMADILNNLGHTLLAANRLGEAETRLRESVQVLENLRRKALGDTYNVSLFDTQIYTYNLLTQILVESHQVESALEASEAGRARAFLELLKSRTPTTAQRPIVDSSLSAIPSIADIQKIAREQNATLVEYALVPEESFRAQGRQRGAISEIHIWVVQPNGAVSFYRQPIDQQGLDLKELVNKMRNSLGRSQSIDRGLANVKPADSLETTEDLKDLYTLLIDPIKAVLPDDPAATVIFIPHEELFLVPFPALQDESGTYLIEQHTLLTAPSIQTLRLTREKKEFLATLSSRDLRSPLVVGNPDMPEVWDSGTETMTSLSALPGAETEALAIADFLGVEALIGSVASEQAVKERINSASIVHLATHGLLEYGNPEDTGIRDSPGAIALAPTSPEQDGLLTSAEILNDLNLTAELVVLSACDTGRGDITGDGVIGLARSFIAAGTPSVLVSLWAVPDAPTAALMTEFYQQLQQGESKAQALRQAMLITLKDNPDPSDWAAFTLIGEAD